MAEISIVKKRGTLPRVMRVAAYARVSSDKDAMLHSLSGQVSYFSKLIQKHRGWKYVGVYSDEGITGTKGNRDGFVRLIDDARGGKIDIILTKSLSRFARNTLDCLRTIREMKELGVDVYFEEQNIHTLSASGEFMISLLAGYAQEESRQVSENVRWRVRKNFQEGKPYGGWTGLGYDVRKGRFKINQKEAEIVRLIFNLYLEGKGAYRIANELNASGYKSKLGNPFTNNTVMEIIKNEAYTGTLVLQKSYVGNHLDKKRLINKGERDLYVVEDHHEAIIDKEIFEKAQRIREGRKPKVTNPKGNHIFTGLIECSCCGRHFMRKTNNGHAVWICCHYLNKGKKGCPASFQMREDTLVEMAARAMGMEKFDEARFREKIEKITQKPKKTVEFRFRDGTKKSLGYAKKSRKDSWTKEMREKAKRKEANGKRKDNTEQD